MHKPQWTEAKDCRVKVDDRRYMCVNHFDCVIGYTCMCVCFRRTLWAGVVVRVCKVVSERLPRQAPLRGPCRGVRVCVLAERALKLERTVLNVFCLCTGVNAICSDCNHPCWKRKSSTGHSKWLWVHFFFRPGCGKTRCFHVMTFRPRADLS